MTPEQARTIAHRTVCDWDSQYDPNETGVIALNNLIERVTEALLTASQKVEWPSEGAVGDWYSIWAESHTGKDGYSRFKAIMAFYSWLRDRMRKGVGDV